jgi:hypothetical protein
MSDASSDLGGIRAGPVERDIEQVPPFSDPPPLLPSRYVDAAPRGGAGRLDFQVPFLFTAARRRRVQSGT